MKEWKDVPEYKKIYDEICSEQKLVEGLEKKDKNEFNPEIKKIHRDWWNRLLGFTERYRKEHPEEFDENGNFKEDTK